MILFEFLISIKCINYFFGFSCKGLNIFIPKIIIFLKFCQEGFLNIFFLFKNFNTKNSYKITSSLCIFDIIVLHPFLNTSLIFHKFFFIFLRCIGLSLKACSMYIFSPFSLKIFFNTNQHKNKCLYINKYHFIFQNKK